MHDGLIILTYVCVRGRSFVLRLFRKKEQTVMRRCLVGCMILFIAENGYCMGPIKKVSPSSTDTLQTIVNRTAQVFDEVTATPVFNSDHVGSSIYLWRSGNYQLVQDLMYPVVITASGVSLDLRQHKIAPYPTAQTAITIASATPLQQIYIKNGLIENFSSAAVSGVYIPANATKIFLKSLTISGFDKGVWCAGTGASNKVTQCYFSDLNLTFNRIGMLFDWSDANIIKQSSAVGSTGSGFELNNCQTNCFFDCQSQQTTGTATTAGFKTAGGTSNLFQRCVVQQTKTSSTTFGDTANGFLLAGAEIKTRVVDCSVSETSVLASSTAVTYGISCVPTLLSGADLFSTAVLLSGQGANINGVALSPDGQYLAAPLFTVATCPVYTFNAATNSLALLTSATAVGTGVGFLAADWSPDGKYLAASVYGTTITDGYGRLRVYSFNGQTLTLAGYSTVPIGQIFSVAWSPNGKFLACVDSTTPGYVRMYSFDGTNLVNISNSSMDTGGFFMSWSPDGSALVVVANNQVTVRVFPVSLSGQLGTVVTTSLPVGVAGLGLKWSPNGKYFAVGDLNTGFIRIFSWNGTAITATCPALLGQGGGSAGIYSISWSPCGSYLATGDSAGRIFLYKFNGTSLSAITTTAVTLNASTFGLVWSADGRFIVAASQDPSSQIIVLRAMYGAQGCCIENCDVNDTLATSQNMGRGFVGGGTNVFLNNVASNNGVNYSYGIPNAYDGRFEILRSTVQPYDNISEPSIL